MSNVFPVISPIGLGSRQYGSFPSFPTFNTYVGETYDGILETIRTYLRDELIPYLLDNSSQQTWDQNAAILTDLVNDALSTQSQTVTGALNEAVHEVITGAIPVEDALVLAVLQSANSQVEAWLTAHYFKRSLDPNAITGWWHVDDFGAKGDDATDDRAVIQSVVDAASARWAGTGIVQRIYFAPKSYRVGWTPYLHNDGTQYGVVGILAKSGVELYGQGIIRALDASYGPGALLSLVRGDEHGVQHFGITDLTFDGRRSTQVSSVQSGNITIENALDDIKIRGVKCYDANGNGIMVTGTFQHPVTDVVIEDCRVIGASMIGIQVSQFNGLTIHHNIVKSTDNNAIDIYGENQGSTLSNGNRFSISGNIISYASVGIFPETVANGVIANNIITDCGEGIHVNRINGEPKNILITGNEIASCVTGVGLTGDTGGVTIEANVLDYFNTAGISLGGAGRVSNYYILDNVMNGTNDQVPLVHVQTGTNQSAHIVHRGTITKSSHREFDTIDGATTQAGNTYVPATQV